MEKFYLTNDQIRRAENLYEFNHLNNSVMEGASNIYGALGEIVVLDHFGGEYSGKYDYDILINNYKVDVKSKLITTRPKPHYYATIAETSLHQNCDYYVFVRVAKNYVANRFVYVVGWKSQNSFFEEASYNKKGEIDPIDNRGFKFKANCYNLQQTFLENHKCLDLSISEKAL